MDACHFRCAEGQAFEKGHFEREQTRTCALFDKTGAAESIDCSLFISGAAKMTAQNGFGQILSPLSVDEALAAMAHGAVPIAGATWVMRAPLRHEPLPGQLLSLSGLNDLHDLTIDTKCASLGAMTTHDKLAVALAPHADLSGLAAAAGNSANPGIRRVATLGGNIATSAFAASDLAPALLAADATVILATASGQKALPMETFLASRAGLGHGGLILRVEIPRSPRNAAHARLPMRKAGDYPCAIVSISVSVLAGMIADIRIAVGAVEPTARRWTALEDRLIGTAYDPARAEAEARKLTDGFTAREAIDAPGWYRLSVLPVLLRRAFLKLQAGV